MPMTFGASTQAAPAYQTNVPAYENYYGGSSGNSTNPYAAILGSAAGLASQFAGGNLAPGAVNQQLPLYAQNQYINTFNQQNAAAKGYSVAGLTPAQQQAMTGIQNAVGYQMPALQQYQGNAQNLAGGVGQSQINSFMNPYTQTAIQGTLGTMQQQNAQQDAAINSQANAAGAWGGDRSAVANNLNDQSWQLAEGNVIGNLENSGYQSAVQNALANQSQQLAGNQQFGNAIQQNIAANTAQYQNLLGVGNQQQAQNQAVINTPITQAQIMGMNLGNGNLGSKGTTGINQNPVTGTLAGLSSGLQFGNQMEGLYNQVANSGLSADQLQSALQGGAEYGAGVNSLGLTNQQLGIGSGSLQYINPAGQSSDYYGSGDAYSNMADIYGSGFTSAGGQAANPGMTATDLGSTNNAAVAGYSYGAPQLPTLTPDQLSNPGMSDVTNAQMPQYNLSGASGVGQAQQALGGVGDVMNIYQGLQNGGVSGTASAALNAAKLYNTGAGMAGASQIPGLSAAGSALGLYNGIKSGTTAGYINAAGNAATLGSTAAIMGSTGAGLGAASAAAGIAALPFAVAAYGASKPSVTLGSQYWNNYSNNMLAGLKPGATTQQQLTTATMLKGLSSFGINTGTDPNGNMDTESWNQGLTQLLSPYGVTDPALANVLANNILSGITNMPGQAAGMRSALGGDQGVASLTSTGSRRSNAN